jgi:tRNA A-37 threonylcarbamoyl transferase component Bud32
MAGEAFSLRKNEGRVRAGLLRVEDETVFVKRIAARSGLRALAETLFGSRARRALAGAAMLKEGGFAHPAPLAAAEDRGRLGIVRAAFVISEALIDAQTFSVFALGLRGELRRNIGRRIAISRAVAHELRRLHEAGLFTRDLQETNLMLEEHPDGFKVYFVDLEDFRKFRRLSQRRRLRNLVHLDRSIGRFVGRAGRLRFLYHYLDKSTERSEVRRLVARLASISYKLEHRRAIRSIGTPGRLRRPIPEG